MNAKFYHWFIGRRILHYPGDHRANMCGIEGWDFSGYREEVRRQFKYMPPVCKRCAKAAGETK